MNSYQTLIKFAGSTDGAFLKLTRVADWWTKDFAGRSAALGDEFIIHHPGAHYAKHKVVEFIPGQKLVWLVTESKLDWLRNPDEWTGTQMIFELVPGELRFKHEGLTPGKESYERCSQGWDLVIKTHLNNFITYNKTI